jgi:hypothetical protein
MIEHAGKHLPRPKMFIRSRYLMIVSLSHLAVLYHLRTLVERMPRRLKEVNERGGAANKF